MHLRGVRLLSLTQPGASPVVDIEIDDGTIRNISPGSRWDGTWVMPGLWDHHVHMEQWARAARRLDLRSATTPAQVLDAAKTAAQAWNIHRDGETLVGTGLWHSRWPAPFGAPGAPNQADLDAVTGSIPTVLISADLHSAWLNSAATHKFGVETQAVSMPNGTGRTSSGLLAEEPWFALMPRLSSEPDQLLDSWVNAAAQAAAARGITGIVDFEFTDTITAWRRRLSNGFDTFRVQAAIWPEYLDAAIEAGYRTGDWLAQGGIKAASTTATGPALPKTSLAQVGPLKIIFDGSLNTRTAWCHAPYPDGSFGAPNLMDHELRQLMLRAHTAGITSAIHAIGDQANTSALDAFAATGAKGSIEHAQLLHHSDIHRFADLGVHASVQPAHLLDDREVAEELWQGQTERAYAFASLEQAGAVLRFGSDAPVAPLDPWLAIRAALTRTADDRPAWHPAELLERTAALRACLARPELRPGDPADLIVLGKNPLEVPAAELMRIPVIRTVCAGRLTHEA